MVASRGTTGTTSKGRQRIKIAYIKDPARRMVTFSKRKKGLLKKASELSLLCDARVAAIVFSQAGRPFAVGSPSVDHVLDLYAPLPAGDEVDEDGLGLGGAFTGNDAIGGGGGDRGAVEATAQKKDATWERVGEEGERMKDIGEKVLRAAAGRFWWEADVEALGAEELREFARALRRLRDDVRRRADKLPVAPCLAADADAFKMQ